MWEAFKDFWTSREPGEGFFGGAEGALRFCAVALLIATISFIYSLS